MVKNPPANAGDVGLVPGLERSPVVETGNPPQYSCLENPMDRGAWWATLRGGCRRAGHDIVTKNNNNQGTQQRMQENNLAGEIST